MNDKYLKAVATYLQDNLNHEILEVREDDEITFITRHNDDIRFIVVVVQEDNEPGFIEEKILMSRELFELKMLDFLASTDTAPASCSLDHLTFKVLTDDKAAIKYHRNVF